jgi:antirestriction protein ArdC
MKLPHENGCGTQFGAGQSGFIAELSSAMLGAELGLPVAHLGNHASTIESWIKLLRHDDRAILTAAARAEEASSLLLQPGRAESKAPYKFRVRAPSALAAY